MHALTDQGDPPAVHAIRALTEASQGDLDLLSYIGSGPLEDLVSHSGNGLKALDEVDQTARREPLFRRALCGVWLGSNVPDLVRERLAILGARDFVAEQAMSTKQFQKYRKERESNGHGVSG